MRNVTTILISKQRGRRRIVESYWAVRVQPPRKCARSTKRVGVKGGKGKKYRI